MLLRSLSSAARRKVFSESLIAAFTQVGQHTKVPLATPGAFGYTVREVPRHVGLATASELGLVAWA